MAKQADQLYQAFLLRCWLTRPSTTAALPTWRFELREVAAEPRVLRFNDVTTLTAHISAAMLKAVEKEIE